MFTLPNVAAAQHALMRGSPATDANPALPCRVDRRAAAELVTRLLFPVSHRTIEAWPLNARLVNGKAIIETVELLDYARAKLDAAPVIRGGRKRAIA